jgi:hypothetical protein
MKKKLVRAMLPDFNTPWLFPTLKEDRGESILGAIAKEIANIEVKLLDAQSFMEEDLAIIGHMTSRRLSVNETISN